MWSDDVLRWRGDGTEGVISYDVDATYIYRRFDGSGVSFVLLLLRSEDVPVTFLVVTYRKTVCRKIHKITKGQCQYKWNVKVPPSTGTAFLSAVFAIGHMQAWTLAYCPHKINELPKVTSWESIHTNQYQIKLSQLSLYADKMYIHTSSLLLR